MAPRCRLLARSRHAYPMDPRRSWLRNPIGRRLPVALTVPAGLASEAVSSKKRPGRVNASPVDGSLRLDFAGAPHRDQYHCSSDDHLNRQVLLHLPVSLSSRPARPTDDSQEHITIGRSHIARGWPWPCRPAERTSSAREAHPCDVVSSYNPLTRMRTANMLGISERQAARRTTPADTRCHESAQRAGSTEHTD